MTISFTKVSLPHGWLGNMAAFPVEFDGKVWPTTEHLFQALRLAPDDPIREEIRAVKSPMGAKMHAKEHADRRVIEPMGDQDLDNMRLCLKLKLEQHPELIPLLIATGDEPIIEDVTNRPPGGTHRFWGAALVDGQWIGQNTLGKLWMERRQIVVE